MKKLGPKEAKQILDWFKKNQRDLPWRKNRDPYRIWIAEVMLQQTTTRAVIPFYERFMERYPTVESLAESSEAELYTYWAGLGYYSRARNLLKAAIEIHRKGFPKKAAELLNLPGFGPYTARAVSSQAFNEEVGVVDGNVIRVLARYLGLDMEWWKTAEKNLLQAQVDQLVKGHHSKVTDPVDSNQPQATHPLKKQSAGDINQAVMELGATICTPKSPTCFLCPWQKNCVARAEDRISSLPRSKPRKKFEIWLWEPQLISRKGQVALIENEYAPFLKGHWFFPGQAKKLTSPPKDFDFRHSITHHQIYVRINKEKAMPKKNLRWVDFENLAQVNPASLLKKAMTQGGLL